MSGRAVTASSFRALEGAVQREIERLRRHDPFARIDVLVGSNLLGIHLKRTLTERIGGLFDVRFLTFVDLVGLLQTGSMGRTSGRLPALAERAIISDMISAGVPDDFRESARTRGFAASLLETFDDLAEGGCTSEVANRITRGHGVDGKLGERLQCILRLFARYRDRLHELGDDTHARFARAVTGCPANGAGTPLLVYGFYDFNEMQWRLIEAFAAGQGVVLFVPWCDDATHRFAARTMARIERNGFTVEQIDRAVDGGDACERLVFSAPCEEDEIGCVVRRMMALAGERGVRFGEMAVLCPTYDPYGTLLVEALDDAGIPFYVHERSGLDGRSPSSGALRLLGLLGGRIARRALAEFLVTAPLGMSNTGGDPFSLWVRTSAEAGVAGANGWIEENRRLIAMLESVDEVDEERRRRVEAARLVGDILERIEAARMVFDGETTWHGYASTFSVLIKELFAPSEDCDRLSAVIDRLGELDRVSGGVSYESFASIVEAALDDLRGSRGRFKGAGVNIMTIGEARGISFRVVFVPGLIERVLPGIVRQDPFLRDEERAALGRLSLGRISLPARMDRLEEVVLQFRLAAGAAREILFCSYPRYEAGTGKVLIPSSFRRLLDPLSREPVRERSMSVRWQASGSDDAARHRPVSEAEYDLAQAFGVMHGVGSLAPNTFLARGIALVKARWGTQRFTAYDGVLSSREVLRELAALLDSRGWSFSPTSMETYAGCPFAYFLTDMLGVEYLEEPERALSISPLERGNIVHSILAQLYDTFRREKLLPLQRAVQGEATALTDTITSRFLDGYPEREPVGLPVFWELERRMISAAILQLVEEESAGDAGYRPAFFEKSFGDRMGGADIPFACTDRTVRFHGRIDRIDMGGGKRFRVIDYKTGSLDRFKDQELGGGTALQLPIYLLAAAELLDRPVADGVAVYWRVGSGPGKRRVMYTGEAWREGMSELTKILDVITRGIERGMFFAVPAPERCAYCVVRDACPSGAVRIFEGKAAGDERCREYLEARGLVE